MILDNAEALIEHMAPEDIAFLQWQVRWMQTARPNQIPPEGDWTEAGFMAGRGFGKTRVGAEWITRAAYEDPSGFDSYVICPTLGDVKRVAIEGESGILSVLPPELLIDHNKTDLTVTIRNCAGGESRLVGFSAERPERLRGPQACRGWFDELAAWQYAEETWDMAMMGLRLGPNPQVVWTTTPKPREIIRRLSAPKEGRIIVRGATTDNRKNLPKSFFEQLEPYIGTKLGRQELDGELIDPEEAGIVQRSWINLWPAKKPLPQFERIIMSLDTAFTERTLDKKGDPDPTACGVWGIFFIKSVAHVLLLDCWEDHLGFPDLLKRVKREMNTRYGDDQDSAIIKPLFGSTKPMTSGRKPDMILIEDKGSGISLRQALAASKIEAYAYNPGRADKLSRLHIVSPIFAQRRVWVPESDRFAGKPRTWCENLIGQLCSFAGEGSIKHDDHVDQCTQALRVAMDTGLLNMLKPTKEERDQRVRDEAERISPTPVVNPYAV